MPPRGDFRDRGIERCRAQRRRGPVDLRGGALDGFGLALAFLLLAVLHLRLPLHLRFTHRLGLRLARRLRPRNLRQPCVEARDRFVQLPCDGGLAARHFGAHGFAARQRLCNLFDLAGDGVEPLMDVGDLAAFPARHRLPLLHAPIRRAWLADGGVEPVVQ